MKVLIICATIIVSVRGGVIHSQEVNHGKATSYQSFNLHHYHPVPTHIKHEDKQYLDHPIGKSTSDVEVHHGDEHSLNYAVQNVHSTLNHDNHQSHVVSGGHSTDLLNHDHGHLLQNQGHEHTLQSYQGLTSQADLSSLTHNHYASGGSLSNHNLLGGYQGQDHEIANYADASQSHYQVSEGESHVQGSEV